MDNSYGQPSAPAPQGAYGGQPEQNEPQYVSIVPSGDTRPREPFRFMLGDKRFDLPHLQSGDMPLELMETVLALTSNVMDDAQESRATGSILAYFRLEQPKIYQALKRGPNQIGYATGLIKQWAEHSTLDPKASGSPTR